MKRTTPIFLCLGIVLAFQPDARPQMIRQPGHHSARPQPSAQSPAANPQPGGAHWRWKGIKAQPQPAKTKPFGAGYDPRVVPQTANPAFGPGFAVRLGNTVGLQAFPPVTMLPGVGNINRPGFPPLPAGQLPPSPNINFPGGVPGLPVQPPVPLNHPQRGRFHGKDFQGHGQTIIYTVPYYVPYTVYVATPAAPAPQPPLQWEAPPRDFGPHIPYTPPPSETPPPAQPSEQKEPPQAQRVTLLAFKDRTIVAVTDYWLEGEMLFYEISPGRASSAPLERLDLVWTQQLNRERSVPFILEAR
ncbi:MAG: hypothetical protein A3H27_08505 [Acidobacteria bacterium RIFCSPLOWO2_02_FULL_59_13]|nr:MAG: hypothetical protein A3H27_08505 [Acidobacteria bacterium RIFCSPLOWO2_02_FULL_59_13]